MRKIGLVTLSVYLLFVGLAPVRAQGSARLGLFALDTSSFPVVSAGLDVFDASGNFVTGLTADMLTLLEDNQPRPVSSLEELQPGTEFALALDPGPFFAYRDAYAVTRFDKVMKAVKEWAVGHPDSLGDDMSLVPTGGKEAAHLVTTAAFLDALNAYQPNLQNLISSVETLSRALDVVSEPTSLPGRKSVVLYITSVPTADALPALQNLTQRAVANHIRVHVWIVASKDFFSTTGATALKDLAIQTGGQSFLYSGEELLPGLETYLAPVRHAYHLTYSSAILASGRHTLTAQVNLNGESISSSELSFELDVQPPNPILVSPPAQVVRTAPDERTTDTTAFLPDQLPVSIIVEFPDGRTRSLIRTVLYVDGIQVAENTSAPFDQFTWDLSGYAATGEHILTVEAVDSYGLRKISLGIPVLVTIVHPQLGLLPWLSRNSLWVALGAILLAGGGLGVILTRGRMIKSRQTSAGRGSRHDPLTQSIQSGGKIRNLFSPRNRPVNQPDAYLVRLKEDGQPITAPALPITTPEMLFGSDPIQATRILDDPSVSPLHARLIEDRGDYILSDEKSVAGTWVNYEQLTAPRRLQHGDVLHIGRFSYRFMLRKPPELPKLRVTPITKEPRLKQGKK